jgi:hypothetical protein
MDVASSKLQLTMQQRSRSAIEKPSRVLLEGHEDRRLSCAAVRTPARSGIARCKCFHQPSRNARDDT